MPEASSGDGSGRDRDTSSGCQHAEALATTGDGPRSIAETLRHRLDNSLFSLVGKLPLHLSWKARELGASGASTSARDAFILPSP